MCLTPKKVLLNNFPKQFAIIQIICPKNFEQVYVLARAVDLSWQTKHIWKVDPTVSFLVTALIHSILKKRYE